MVLWTIYVVVGATGLLIGLVQIGAYFTGRFGRWPLWWGASNLAIGVGDVGLALQPILAAPSLITLCNIAILAGYVLLLGGVRDFAQRQLPVWAVVAVVFGVMVALWFDAPGDFVVRVAILSVLLAAFDFAIAFESIGLARREHLRSGWIMAALFGVSATMFAARSVLTAAGTFGSDTLFGSGSDAHSVVAIPAVAILMLRGMALLLLAAEQHHARMETIAYRDPLTGALTRMGLRHAKEILLHGSPGRNLHASVLLIDIDHFKKINDTRGHAVGDAVLCMVAEAARRMLARHGFVSRWGGDEFVILLPATTASEAIGVANALGQQVRNNAISEAPATLSIGVAEGYLQIGSLGDLVKKADAALYEVKRAGRDGALIFG